jgi:hypothetical protein
VGSGSALSFHRLRHNTVHYRELSFFGVRLAT